ncbi:MAG: Ig-like domain-containing protein [Bacteroidota bacterium]|nr:Ig-like domain-containing protein [Bacteroidota bacterium]
MKYFRSLLFLLPFLLLVACSDDDGVTDPNDNNNNNNNADTEKPVVEITNPTADQEISGDVLLVEINATDNHRVEKVEVYLSTSPFPLATLTSAPWRTTFDISDLAPGAYAVSAKAFDSTGNESNRSTVTFIITAPGGFRFSFTDGAMFTYDRWGLDGDNQILPSTKSTYVSRYEQGDGTPVGGETDWYRIISTDSRSGRSDTMIARVDAQNNIQVYGLANELVERFTRELIDSGTLPQAPVLPAPEWTYLARVNDMNGDALEPGGEWDVTQGSGIEISFGLISATVSMKGAFIEQGEVFSVQSRDISTWKVRITVTISVLGQDNDIPVNIWFSDDPSAQLRLMQESAELNLGLVQFPVEGDLQALVSWE